MNIYRIQASNHDTEYSYLLLGPGGLTEEEFNEKCLSLLDSAVDLAVENKGKPTDLDWVQAGHIDMNCIADYLTKLLEKEGYQRLMPPTTNLSGGTVGGHFSPILYEDFYNDDDGVTHLSKESYEKCQRHNITLFSTATFKD